MTPRKENRIWRGLFLAALIGGCGVAATSGARADKVVGGFANARDGRNYLITNSGELYEFRGDITPMMGGAPTGAFRKVDMTGLSK